MKTVVADFKKRVAEIEVYLRYLEAIAERDAKPITTARSKTIRDIDPELVKVLKANMFLLLYNLVESSVRQAITEICDTISSEKLAYSDASDQIKRIWLNEGHQGFKNMSTQEIFQFLENLPDDVIEIKFRPGITGGNVDGRKIREFADEYGFSCVVHRNANEGVKLYDVKNRRNDLAHGLQSFAECGRNYTVPDLQKTKHEVVMYLRGILQNVSRYLEQKRFRA